MKNLVFLSVLLMSVCLTATYGFSSPKKVEKYDGKKEFKEHCAACHPDGGNVINKSKTLHVQSLKASGIKSTKDVIAKMRNPGPGMTKFDEKTIPSKEAKAIAEYIFKTFK